MTAPNTQTQANANTNPQRGIASLTWDNHVLRFRTNPNEVNWNYSLITKTDQTYGGRVVQILGTKVDDLTVKIDCGLGGWPYLVKVVAFMRDLMVAQRNGRPAIFEYTTRNWKLKVYAASFPFGDQVTATTRELTLQFKVQEDISGIISSATVAAALQSLANGIGWQRSQYNDYYAPINDTGILPTASTVTNAARNLPVIGNAPMNGQASQIQSAVSSVTGGAAGAAVDAANIIPSYANLFTIPGM
jgi:hypothetical protein